MAKTVKISDAYHSWIKAHNREDETMEETIRRLTGGPHPEDVAGLLSAEEAEAMKEAVDRIPGSDRRRKERASDRFSTDNS